MSEQYLLFLNNFKSHLEQLKTCQVKVSSRCEKSFKIQEKYIEYISPIKEKIYSIFNEFSANLAEISLPKLNEYSTNLTFLREENNFYINSFDVLASGESELKKELKSELSKINFLVDAALKLKFFIVDRFGKIIEKFSSENHDELTQIKEEAVRITDEINIKASLLNAQTTLLFASEMECASKLQTLEATINELNKRFTSVG